MLSRASMEKTSSCGHAVRKVCCLCLAAAASALQNGSANLPYRTGHFLAYSGNCSWSVANFKRGLADSCDAVKVAGGEDESVMMPLWTEKGLVFISDRSGWWNLYLEEAAGQLQALCPRDAEFGTPPWVFGLQTFELLPDGRCAQLATVLFACLLLMINGM